MTGDDDLRRRLRGVDPARPGGPTDPQQSPSAHEILERAMRTADLHDSSTPVDDETSPRPGRRRWLAMAGVAATAVVAIGGGLALTGVLGGGDETAIGPTTLALTAAPGDPSASCLVFDVATLAQAPTALAGTVVSVADGTATLDVDRWYRGGDADRVTVSTAGQSAALDGTELVAGGEYLITAADGVVSSCGYSGPASAELESAYDEAFGG